MQTRPVMYKNAEAVHRNNEPEAPTILTEVWANPALCFYWSSKISVPAGVRKKQTR